MAHDDWTQVVNKLTLDLLRALDHTQSLSDVPQDDDVIWQAVLKAHLICQQNGEEMNKLARLREDLTETSPSTPLGMLAIALAVELNGLWTSFPLRRGETALAHLDVEGRRRLIAISLVHNDDVISAIDVPALTGDAVGRQDFTAYLRGLPPGISIDTPDLRTAIKEALDTAGRQKNAQYVEFLEGCLEDLRRSFLLSRLGQVRKQAKKAQKHLEEKRLGDHMWDVIIASDTPATKACEIQLSVVEGDPDVAKGSRALLEDVIANSAIPFLAIVGPGGCGKSFALARNVSRRLEAWSQAKDNAPESRVPIFLVPSEVDYQSRIWSEAGKIFGDDDVQVALRIGALDATIDALNEVSPSQRDLRPLAEQFPRVRFIVASRQQFFLDVLPEGTRYFFVCPLEDRELEDYLRDTVGFEQTWGEILPLLRPHSDMRVACQQPMILDGLVHLARVQEALPGSRFDLLNCLIQRVFEEGYTPMDDIDKVREGLGCLAWGMYDVPETREPLTEIGEADAERVLKDHFEGHSTHVSQVLQCKLVGTGIGDSSSLRFAHHVFMETFASVHLAGMVRKEGTSAVHPYLLWPRYDTVILGLIGLIQQPSVLQELLALVADTAPRVLAERAISLDWIETTAAEEMCKQLARSATDSRNVRARREEAIDTLKTFVNRAASRLAQPALVTCLALVSDTSLPPGMRVSASEAFSAQSATELRSTEPQLLLPFADRIVHAQKTIDAENLMGGVEQALAHAFGTVLSAGVFAADVEKEEELLVAFVERNRQFENVMRMAKVLHQLLGGGSSPDFESPLLVLARAGGPRIRSRLLDLLSTSTGNDSLIAQIGQLAGTADIVVLLRSDSASQRKRALDALISVTSPFQPDIIARVLPLVRDVDYQVRQSADAALETILKIRDLTLDVESGELRAILAGTDPKLPEQYIATGGLHGLAAAWRGVSWDKLAPILPSQLDRPEPLETFALCCYAIRKEKSYPEKVLSAFETLGRESLHRSELSEAEIDLALELVYFFVAKVNEGEASSSVIKFLRPSEPYAFALMLTKTLYTLDTIEHPLNYARFPNIGCQAPTFGRLIADDDPAVQKVGVENIVRQCGSTLEDRRGLYQRITALAYEDIPSLYEPLAIWALAMENSAGKKDNLLSLLQKESGIDAVHVACVLIMWCLALEQKGSFDSISRSEVVEVLTDLAHRTDPSPKDLIPLLIPFTEDARIRQVLRRLLNCAYSELSPSESNEIFSIYIGILEFDIETDEWANWAVVRLTSRKPSPEQHQFVLKRYRHSKDPIKSRLYRVLSLWADKYGLPPRPE